MKSANTERIAPVTAGAFDWNLLRTNVERTLVATPRSREALQNLVNAGIDKTAMLDQLIALWFAMSNEQDPDRQRMREKWKAWRGSPLGMTWSQFGRRLEKYEEIATEIAQINESRLYAPLIWLPYRFPWEGPRNRDLRVVLQRTKLLVRHMRRLNSQAQSNKKFVLCSLVFR